MGRLGIGRRHVLAGVGGLLAAPAILRAQGQGGGVALVIGNSKYDWEASLPNVKRDAPDIANAFTAMGLKTELVQDAGRAAMSAAIEKFKAAAAGANLAAFYFAGHGAQWNNEAFLAPVDADLGVPRTDGLVSTSLVRAAARAARYKLRVYDNCRNNPADGWRQKQAVDASRVGASGQAAFARNNANSLELYSTAPGRAALDGPPGQNSPFAAALLRALGGDSVDLHSMAAKLRRDVEISTRGRQVVVDYSSLRGPVALKGTARGGPRPAGADGAVILELPQAYAFAEANGCLLPQGLVAVRQAGGADNQKKVGSYKYRFGKDVEIMILLSADAADEPEFLISGPVGTGFWRLIKGRFNKDRLEGKQKDQPDAPYYSFTWKSANGGTLDVSRPDAVRNRYEPTFPG
jgi:Caspase domain